jgi:hypothetical protein
MMPWHHVYNWLHEPWARARRAEARLAETENATITLRVIIDDCTVAEYALTAFRLSSKGDWCTQTHAYGDGAVFSVVTDIEVSAVSTPDGPYWRVNPFDEHTRMWADEIRGET